MKKIALLLSFTIIASSCASKKDLEALQVKHEKTKKELLAANTNLQKCLIEKERYQNQASTLETTVADLRKDKENTLNQVENLTVLTKGANDNIKETLSQLSKKDKYINKIRAAASKKDSLNLVVAFHLKKELQEGIDDKDIEVNVEKTVVFISISDKLLFKSGSYAITDKASSVLQKVATVVNGQPEMDVMIEGHTDDTPINTAAVKDNWDLSVKRSTAIVRALQNQYGVAPSRLIAAGRSSYVPLVSNDSPVNKSKNRRTKIIILPRLNQFFNLLDQKVE
ncbi:flagellar motor protein MotB [Tenacibaculum maritimum]|uniref:OmpA/MotB family protein n=1 Tax=Tenacibaculum maritimum TaxID=107401 RepID=UPI0012E5E406|nr:OmpA family protein [Tenacibaculum maritimum]MCD9580895.1 OmpA family protein [Tenacibaculum maritimum]MCD9635169.1 OmpA family protein [Tenacibaculum maritimum]CAA0153997.1 Flagellar motor/Chemotaxis (MotB)-related lipoprotein precursor [Tenacibaculum maritimum]CAA0158446.1 Flagellar motor/Chemotaxis (MotB)-related lipoprotein precursor [Tenacibaculum maritimum]CAA0200023.1 Flagellar motor/Chemotaxis (MotB)-related lipoprotein precursor [Tenacibaculum maritimum]